MVLNAFGVRNDIVAGEETNVDHPLGVVTRV